MKKDDIEWYINNVFKEDFFEISDIRKREQEILKDIYDIFLVYPSQYLNAIKQVYKN